MATGNRTYLLTLWSRVLLEKLTGFQVVKKFSAFYRTRMFITAFTIARHLSLSGASSIRSTPLHEWVPVTTAWRVLNLRMGGRPPIWRVAANILNKQSRTTDKVWPSSLGVGRGANNCFKLCLLRNTNTCVALPIIYSFK